MESSPLAELVQTLTTLNHNQHQALVQLHCAQEQHIKDPLNAQAEDWQVLQGLVRQVGAPAAASPVHIATMKMGA